MYAKRDNKKDGNILFAFVHDVFGYWTLSKGSPLENEEATGAAERKVKEELGIKSAKVIEKLGQNEYIAKDPEKGQVRRKVDYFLLETEDRDLNLEPSGGLDDAKWFKVDELKDIKTYPDIKPLFSKALEIINKQS